MNLIEYLSYEAPYREFMINNNVISTSNRDKYKLTSLDGIENIKELHYFNYYNVKMRGKKLVQFPIYKSIPWHILFNTNLEKLLNVFHLRYINDVRFYEIKIQLKKRDNIMRFF